MPKTNFSSSFELAKLSNDCSFLLTHLIRQNDGKTDEQAKDILSQILDLFATDPKPILKASGTGWYHTSTANIYNPTSGQFEEHITNKSVCFTESTLGGLQAHSQIFNSKYGLAFSRYQLSKKGANPCINIHESIFRKKVETSDGKTKYVYNFLPKPILPFVNVINDRFDSTHEREWRYPGNLEFSYCDLVFVFCPKQDFELFSLSQKAGMPVLFDLNFLNYM